MVVNFSNLHSKILPYLFADSIKDIDNFYCSLKETYEWQKSQKNIESLSAKSFELKLKNFILKRNETPDADNIRVIIGGIGTGKSTTINYIFKKYLSGQVKCEKALSPDKICYKRPQILNLNFEAHEEEDIDEPYDSKMGDKFWRTIVSNIQITANITFDLDQNEAVKFLSWCLTQKRLLANSSTIHKYLESNKVRIDSYINQKEVMGFSGPQLLKIIIYSLDELIKEMQPEDFCWYLVYKYKYQLIADRSNGCQCIYILLDNVDHLHPEVQKDAVSFAINLTEILSARTIITIRPLTWERSSHAHKLVDTLYQYSPSIKDVIKKRVTWFLQKEDVTRAERIALISLTKIMTGKGYKGDYFSPLSNLLKSTSGIGVRFALRNFANMLESPILSSINVEPRVKNIFESFKIWELARAYFFGMRQNLIPQSFENLYYVDQKQATPLLKMRILDFVSRIANGETDLTKLLNFVESFGYEKYLIILALNELLSRQRPLLWCNTSYKLYLPDSNTTINARILITPIGKGYIQELFGSTFYDEQCLATSLNEFVGIENLYNFHKEITDNDIIDIQNYCNSNSSYLYKKFYPSNIISLSYLHWKNLEIAIGKIANYASNFTYDIERSEWLKVKIENALNEPE